DQLEQATEQAEHDGVPLDALPELITQLEDRMKTAAKNLEFEEAANLRDRIKGLRQKLVGKA
ncbi:MAG: UvrB/UvrC motif-containing protein, partial [Cyanobium sp.]